MKTSAMLVLGITLLGAALPASAHHGFAVEYDRSKQVTLVGKLTMVALENPHGWLYIDAKDSQGKIVNWALELPGPAVLRLNGFDQGVYESLRTSGEVVTVTAYAAKDGSKHAIGQSLTRADGKTVIPLQRGARGGFDRGQRPGAGTQSPGTQSQ
jgi:Family of unknown function (DUF6152)